MLLGHNMRVLLSFESLSVNNTWGRDMIISLLICHLMPNEHCFIFTLNDISVHKMYHNHNMFVLFSLGKFIINFSLYIIWAI